MAFHSLAAPIAADHFSFEPGEYVGGDDQARIKLPSAVAGLIGASELSRGEIEQLAETEVWNARPRIDAALLIDLLDRVDGDADSEAGGDELEDSEALQNGVDELGHTVTSWFSLKHGDCEDDEDESCSDFASGSECLDPA